MQAGSGKMQPGKGRSLFSPPVPGMSSCPCPCLCAVQGKRGKVKNCRWCVYAEQYVHQARQGMAKVAVYRHGRQAWLSQRPADREATRQAVAGLPGEGNEREERLPWHATPREMSFLFFDWPHNSQRRMRCIDTP